MCFSADASFTASAVLAILGVATLKRASVKNEWLLASVPLLFAMQQLTEGVLWLVLRGNLHISPFWPIQLYALFVGVIWPVFVPLSLLLIEPDDRRRAHFTVPLLLGLGVAGYSLWSLVHAGVTAQIDNQCILYETPAYAGIVLIAAYVIATCTGFLCSSNRSLVMIGWLNIAGFAAAFYFYRVHLTSTWCFFAAILSGLLYFHFTGFFERRPAQEAA